MWYDSYPALRLGQAFFLGITGAFDACVRCLDEVEQRLALAESEQARWLMARVTAQHCFLACVQNELAEAQAYGNRALRDLREEDVAFRAGIHHSLGDTYRQNGRWEEARANYLEVLNLPNHPAFRIESVHVFGALADLDLRQGELLNAAAYWRKALAAIQDQANWGNLPLPLAGWVYIRMGEILYEWNQLAEAGDHVARGLKRAELGGDVQARIAGYLVTSRLKLTENDIEAAAAYLELARPLVEQAPFPDWTSRFERLQVELWLAQDRLRAAVIWADERLQSGRLEGRPESEAAHLAVARVLIVKGDAPAIERAKALLKDLIEAAEGEGRTGLSIESLALQALAEWKRSERAGAMTALERALRLAEPEGYTRLFVDLGLPMARLLQEARSRTVMPDYVDQLLAAFGAGLSFPAHAEAALPEPLSPREQEILERLAAGLTNREIAEQLVISAETVKKHTGSIYGKLGVRSRTEAAAKARVLGLLD